MTKVIDLYPNSFYEEKGEKFFLKGMAALEEENYESALLEFKNAVEVSPTNPQYAFFAGLTAYFFEESVATMYFEKAVECDSNNIDYLNWLGISLFKDEEFINALMTFEKSLNINNIDNEKAYVYTARTLSKLKNYSLLKEFVLTVLDHGITYPELYYELGNVYCLELDFDNAEKFLLYSIDLSVHYTASYHLLSKVYCKKGDFENAIAVLKELAYYNESEAELANAKINSIEVLKSF